jgi:hypothetical protein
VKEYNQNIKELEKKIKELERNHEKKLKETEKALTKKDKIIESYEKEQITLNEKMEKEKNKVEKELEILRKANDLLTQENYTHMEVNKQLRQEIKLLNEEENKQEKFESSSLCPVIISKDASTTTCDLSNSDNNSNLEVLTEIQVLRNANITLKEDLIFKKKKSLA